MRVDLLPHDIDTEGNKCYRCTIRIYVTFIPHPIPSLDPLHYLLRLFRLCLVWFRYLLDRLGC